jgi:ABC-type transport system substrate-binding protein
VELIRDVIGDNPAFEVKDGKYDMTLTEFGDELEAQVENENSQSKGQPLTLTVYAGNELGYIGINSQRVSCASESSTYQSKALRAAFCVLFDYYKKTSVQAYFGGGAELTCLPLASNSIFAAADISGYIYDSNGNAIFTDEMTAKEQETAALEAAVGYLKKAGFEFDQAGNTAIKAADGASLEYSVYTVKASTCSDAFSAALKNASDALSSIGLTLNTYSLDSESELERMLLAGECDMWVGSCKLSREPDVYSYFHSKSNSPVAPLDKNLDSVITAALKKSNESERAEEYAEIFRIALQNAFGVCGYVNKLALVYSADRVQLAEDEQYTVYYTLYDDLYKLKLK